MCLSRGSVASTDRTAVLWEVATGEPIVEYNGHHKGVTAVALNDSSIEWKRHSPASWISAIRYRILTSCLPSISAFLARMSNACCFMPIMFTYASSGRLSQGDSVSPFEVVNRGDIDEAVNRFCSPTNPDTHLLASAVLLDVRLQETRLSGLYMQKNLKFRLILNFDANTTHWRRLLCEFECDYVQWTVRSAGVVPTTTGSIRFARSHNIHLTKSTSDYIVASSVRNTRSCN